MAAHLNQSEFDAGVDKVDAVENVAAAAAAAVDVGVNVDVENRKRRLDEENSFFKKPRFSISSFSIE